VTTNQPFVDMVRHLRDVARSLSDKPAEWLEDQLAAERQRGAAAEDAEHIANRGGDW
jgi:hypothetical protein